MDSVLAATAIKQHRGRKPGQTGHIIKLAHHKQSTVRTDLRTPEFQPDPAVEADPITPV